MNITIKTLRKNDDLIKQLKSSQKSLLKYVMKIIKLKNSKKLLSD